jgi:hypothetical protein
MSANTEQENRFYMWRTILAVAHADGTVCDDEKEYLQSVINKMSERGFVSGAQQEILISDLNKQQDSAEMISQIDDPKYRGQIMHFATMLANKDGKTCRDENELINYLYFQATKDLDMNLIKAEARAATQAYMVEHEVKNIDSQRESRGIIGFIDRILLNLGIDVMDI